MITSLNIIEANKLPKYNQFEIYTSFRTTIALLTDINKAYKEIDVYIDNLRQFPMLIDLLRKNRTLQLCNIYVSKDLFDIYQNTILEYYEEIKPQTHNIYEKSHQRKKSELQFSISI